MKKFLFFIIGTLFLGFSVKAYYLTPAMGTMTKGGSSNIVVIAMPGTAISADVRLRMTLVNAKVNSFSPTSSFTSVPPVGCTSTDNIICVDLEKSSNIISGETIGTLNVTWANTNGISTFTKTDNNSYYDLGTDNVNPRIVGYYTLGIIPATPFNPDSFSKILLLGAGFGMFIMGFYLTKYLKNEKKIFQE